MNRLADAASLIAEGRQLQILDHKVHRIDAIKYTTNDEEQEMIVSNLRFFTLNIGVLDANSNANLLDVPLKAVLLYENGQPVEHSVGYKPPLDGETTVTAMQGFALFKLRINTLSTYHGKQRFRVQISPVDESLLIEEPGLAVVTTPMKCVTKLGRRLDDDNIQEGIADQRRRKKFDLPELVESQGEQLYLIRQTLEQVRGMCHQLLQ